MSTLDKTLDPHGGDPVIKNITRLKGRRLIFTCILLSVLPLIAFVLTIFDGTFINPSMHADLMHDYGDIVLYLFGFPVTVLVIAWYSQKLPMALETLEKNEIVIISEDDWSVFIQTANKIFSNKVLKFLPYIFASCITLFLIISYFLPGTVTYWYSLQGGHKVYWAAIAMIPVYFLTFFSLSYAIILIIKAYIVLKELFNNHKIEVQVLHPDNCGGLSSLGALSKTLNLWIFFVGVIAATNIYMNIRLFGGSLLSPFEIAIMAGYILSAYIVFFMPLHATYKSMKKAKFDSMQRINKYFVSIDSKIKRELDSIGQIDNMDIESIENINKLYELAAKMPVYPYDIKTVTSFLGSIFVPVLMFILEILLKSFL
jgi:hypothetical protein